MLSDQLSLILIIYLPAFNVLKAHFVMQYELSKNALKLLQRLKKDVEKGKSAKFSLGTAGLEIIDFCDNQAISVHYPAGSKTVTLGEASLKEIERCLGLPLDTDFSNMTRAQVSPMRANEKDAGIAPTEFQLLIAITDSALDDTLRNALGKHERDWQFNIEVHPLKVDLNLYDNLVVVENRDSFNDWQQYQHNLSKSLVVYRGDFAHSKACKHLLNRWRQEKPQAPCIYFGDFDLAGLNIAVHRQYDALLIPNMSTLKQYVTPAHYEIKQEKFLDELRVHVPRAWLHLLELISKHRVGLRQQRMYETPLILYSK